MQHANDKLSKRVILRAAPSAQPSAQPTSSTDATAPLLRRLVKGSRGAAVAAATAPPVPAANDQGGAVDWVGMELMRGLLNYRALTPPSSLSAESAESGERCRGKGGGLGAAGTCHSSEGHSLSRTHHPRQTYLSICVD